MISFQAAVTYLYKSFPVSVQLRCLADGSNNVARLIIEIESKIMDWWRLIKGFFQDVFWLDK